MKKITKKMMSVVLVLTLALSMAACGKKTGDDNDNNATAEKPSVIKVMMDGTVVTEANGREAFEKALENAIGGVDIQFNQPEHSGYYDVVSGTFASGSWPDVILLGAAYYVTYANAGALADISEYWENSEMKKNGVHINPSVVESFYTVNDEGKHGLYGFAPTRGNGCVTYVKQTWLDKWAEAAGKDYPKNYDEYYDMIKFFTENDMDGSGDPSNTVGVSAAGLIGTEAPYTNYLPEFYQDAYPDFYQNTNGEWVDGFGEAAMEGALQRLQDAYQAGYIEKETLTNGTSDCRNKFYEDKFGVFTYWAGTWAQNLKSNLESSGMDGELFVLPPIAELGSYLERWSPVWCITTQCENPEGVFKYFFDTMLDGGDVMSLWTFGVKGTHWNDAAETITWGTNEKEFKEGEFHFLNNLENPETLYTKNHIDPNLSYGAFKAGKDPSLTSPTRSDVALDCASKFNDWCALAPAITSNETMLAYSGDLLDIRKKVVTDVIVNGMSVADGMAMYRSDAGNMVQEILDSLNK